MQNNQESKDLNPRAFWEDLSLTSNSCTRYTLVDDEKYIAYYLPADSRPAHFYTGVRTKFKDLVTQDVMAKRIEDRKLSRPGTAMEIPVELFYLVITGKI
jgi:hypothetical protein